MQAVFFVPDQFPTIQEAVDSVVGPTTIMVVPGAYDETVVVRDRPSVVIESTRLGKRGVTITGRDDAGVLVVERSTLHLSGIEVRSNGRRRGFCVTDSTLSLQDCVVAGNRTGTGTGAEHPEGGSGAGLWCRDSSIRIQKSTIAGNTADASGTAGAARGGGLFLERCTVEIAGSTVSANAAYADTRASGGGIWCSRGRMRMWRSRVTDNALRATLCEGAGHYLEDLLDGQLGGSVITGNGSAEGRGGGLYVAGDPAGVSIHGNTVVRQNHPEDVFPGIGR